MFILSLFIVCFRQEIGYRYGREKRDEAIKAIREYIEMLQLEPDENKL